MDAALFADNIAFRGDLARNIPGVRKSQQLFDDLSAEPADWDIAAALEGEERIPTAAAFITRPFDYGSVITYTFDSAHWQATRFSDGTRYGVWYGSTSVETTVYETAWHWYRFVADSFPGEDRTIVSERRVFDVQCEALLIDLRDKAATHPALVSRTDYTLTHEVGRYAKAQALNGLLAPSARCEGTNGAILNPDRLSNVRDRTYLRYRLNPARDTFVAERTPGRRWLAFTPSALG